MRIDLLEAFGLEPKIIDVLKSKYDAELLPIQERAFRDNLILRGGNFLISAVTSSGKTLIGEILALHYGSRGRRAIYLVPMKALAEEKFEQFYEDYRKTGIDTVISTHDRREDDERILSGKYHIAIVVYEKLNALLVQKPSLISDVGLVVVDELQYMTDEDRGPSLELLLTRILLHRDQPQLVALSAVLGKSDALARWLRATLIIEENRPVELRQGVFYEGKFRYREFNSGNKGDETWFDLQSAKEMDQYVETACHLAGKLGEQTVFFLPDKPSTEGLARRLTRALNLDPAHGALAEMNSLEESVSREMLLQTLQNGIAVHNADLSWEERDIIERYTRQGEIRVLCTTSTLAVGLNLPMKNAVIAPKRWKTFGKTREVMPVNLTVSEYENMGGRVARYGYIFDFGRAVFVTHSFVNSKFYYDHYACGRLEDFAPALDRNSMDKHILNLVAAEICHSEEQIKTFLKSTYTAATVWNKEMTDAEYDRAVADTVNACLKEKLIVKDKGNTLTATETGKVAAGKGVSIETATFFLKFLNNTDPRHVTELEVLLLMGLCHDSRMNYLSLKRQDGRWGGYRDELKQIIYENGEGYKPLFQSLWEMDNLFLDDKDRAVKKALMMQVWLSTAETKDIERNYQVFSGAIRKVGEDFSWLAETLAALAKVIGWEERFVRVITHLSQRLIHGITEKGLALSSIRIRGLGRSHINRLVHEGYDTPEAIADLPLAELERLLPKRLAEKLYSYFPGRYQNTEETKTRPTGVREPTSENETKNVKSTPAKPEETVTCSLSKIINDDQKRKELCANLNVTKDLRKLISDPPVLLMDIRQMLIFYHGAQVILPLMSFRLLELLAGNPKSVITREQIYERLWPECEGNDDSSRPYEQQITDHKRKLLGVIRKGIKEIPGIDPGELKNLIVTRPRMGYMLHLDREDIVVL